jgi:hypothetical protein
MAEKVATRITKRTARMTLINPLPLRKKVYLQCSMLLKIANPSRECQLILIHARFNSLVKRRIGSTIPEGLNSPGVGAFEVTEGKISSA